MWINSVGFLQSRCHHSLSAFLCPCPWTCRSSCPQNQHKLCKTLDRLLYRMVDPGLQLRNINDMNVAMHNFWSWFHCCGCLGSAPRHCERPQDSDHSPFSSQSSHFSSQSFHSVDRRWLLWWLCCALCWPLYWPLATLRLLDPFQVMFSPLVQVWPLAILPCAWPLWFHPMLLGLTILYSSS